MILRRLAPFVLLAVLAVACSSSTPSRPQGRVSPTESADSSGGTSLGSCVERYSPETLTARSFAFDGTVSSVEKGTTETGSDSVTFSVNRWYKGGDDGGSVTLKAFGVGGVTSAGSISGTAGERLLVTGDEDTIWTCGFTQPYTTQAAAEWEAAFAAGG